VKEPDYLAAKPVEEMIDQFGYVPLVSAHQRLTKMLAAEPP